MQERNFESLTEVPSETMSRLTKLKLNEVPGVVDIFKVHYKQSHWLIPFLQILKELSVPFTPVLIQKIQESITNTHVVFCILQDLRDILEKAPLLYSLERLFDVQDKPAGTSNAFRHAVRQLYNASILNCETLDFLVAYAPASHFLYEMLIFVANQQLNPHHIVSALHGYDPQSIHQPSELILTLVKVKQFSDERLKLVVKLPHIEDILEGVKALAGHPCPEEQLILFDRYFKIINKYPEHALTVARTLILLRNENYIDFDNLEVQAQLGKFGIGTFLFLTNLKKANLLNPENYLIICNHHHRLNDEGVALEFQKLRLFDAFSSDELTQILHRIQDSRSDESVIQKFREMGRVHDNGGQNGLVLDCNNRVNCP
jgi:hypothetical protein